MGTTTYGCAIAHDLDSTIDLYIGYFKKKVQRLKNYVLDTEDRILKKNILVSILDALSITTSNYADSNRERFTGIVAKFGGWPHHARISAPHVRFGSIADVPLRR
jgi:hypothetical protein